MKIILEYLKNKKINNTINKIVVSNLPHFITLYS